MGERQLELGERDVAAARNGAFVVVHRCEERKLKVKGSSLVSRSHSMVCPLCEVGELRHFGNGSIGCGSCSAHLGGAILETLRQITTLPDALGAHACEECGHPEMRLLPDGVFHCPSCGSEVLRLEYRCTQ
jgi:ribosomal protein L37AE/L43A